MRLPSEGEEKRMRFYNQGLNDQQIAQRVGLVRCTISFWRRSRGLPSHGRRLRITPEDEEERMRLYNQGLIDREIAQRVGRTGAAIFIWRKKRGLPTHPSKYPRRLDWGAITSDYLAKLSCTKIGQKYGTSPSHVYRIVKRAGITPRTVSEARLIKTHNWRRLSPMAGAATRILSLPAQYYEKLGFSRRDELEGKWVVKNGELVLEIRNRQHEREQE